MIKIQTGKTLARCMVEANSWGFCSRWEWTCKSSAENHIFVENQDWLYDIELKFELAIGRGICLDRLIRVVLRTREW